MDRLPVAVITYVGNGFSLQVPAGWERLATEHHLVVFLGPAEGGIRTSITLSRYPGSTQEAAERARLDHAERFAGYEILHESSGTDALYRRFRWVSNEGTRIIQHQLFAPGLVLTATRADRQSTTGDEEALASAIRTLRVAAGRGRAGRGER
jgi:hypothetical protein